MGISRTAPALVICALLSSSLTFAAPPENGREAASPPSAVSSPASSPEAVAPSTALTPELLSAQRQAIESNQALAPEIRTKALDLYTQALDHLRAVEVFRNQAAAYQDLAQSAPELAQQIQEDLDTPVPPPDLTDWREVPLVQLEQALATAETGLTAKQQQLQDQESGPQRRAERQSILPGLLVTARSRLQEALAQLQRPEGEDPAAVAARQAALQAEMEHLNSEVTAYEQELLSYGVTSAYDTLLQDQARRDAATAEKWVKALRELVEQQREEEARLAAEEARRTMEQMLGAAPAVQALFHDVVTLNTQLAEQRTQPEGVIKKLALASQQNEQLTQRLTEVRAQYQSVQERIKVAGHSESVGMLLRRYKSQLPNLRLLNQQIREHGAGIAETDLALIDAREQRAAVADIEQRVADILEKLPPSYNEDARTQIANTMRAQLQSQRDLLQALNQDYQRYSTQLNTLVSQERELATVVGEFGDFIDANILWSGGARILRPSDLANIHEALYWLIAPDAWQKTLSGLTDDLLGNPLHYGLATLSFLILLYCCVAFRPRLQALGEQARKKWHTTYNQTPAALAITFIQTLPAPLVLAFTAWRLAAVQGTLFPGALAQGLTSVAVLCLVLGFTRQMFMPLGLVEAHFEWTAGQVRGTRHHFGLLLLVLAPLVFLIFCFEYQPVEDWKTSLGRVAFLAAMGAVLVTLFPLLARVLRAMLADETTWLSEHHGARLFLLLVAAGLPLLLALVAVSGYYYTALQLSVRLFWTATYCLALLFAFAMMRRWLVVTRRKLAVEQARRRRDTAKDDSGDKTVQEFTAEELDLARIDTQTQNLLRSVAVLALFFGVYFIWAGILPALKILERQELWHTRMEVEQQVPTQAGAPSEKQVTAVVRLQPVTAADAVFALLIAAFTIVAVQNLPSLIEIILLRWLKLGSGERYATIAIVRYTLVALGVFFVLRALGVGWNNVQWLLAAIGLGLGFGLQEIFANFVSGLILLFERPVRVGDIVTIGDKSGVVSRIRIRATTVTDWDKKDLVIPNKELITSQVMNWTLTDTTLRLKLRVGIAYGSDLQRARDTLLRVIEEHPDVLKEPKPFIVLEQFGGSSIDFDVYLYVKLENGGKVKTELHMNIAQALHQAGIEIPFPQQDIHLRSGLENLSPPRPTQSPS